MSRSLSLFGAVRMTGWTPVRYARPGSHPDRLGKQRAHSRAAVLRGERIAIRYDLWALAYDVSHEIVEAQHRFAGHSEQLFIDQANLLAFWHQMRSTGRRPRGLRLFAPAVPD